MRGLLLNISVETNSPGWQVSQLQQRLLEKWELIGNQFAGSLADVSFPGWLNSTLVRLIIHLLFWVMIALLLILLMWKGQQLVKWYKRKIKSRNNRKIIKNIPEKKQDYSVDYWVIQAQKAEKKGEYQEVCQCLYQAMLQQLDSRNIVPHKSSRTDGEYEEIIVKIPQYQSYQQLLWIHQEL